MGYTDFTIRLVEKYFKPKMKVLDFGSQNNYSTGETPPPFMSEWYMGKGVEKYVSVDLAGDNGSLKLDCAYPLPLDHDFGLVCDIGFSEHCVQMQDHSCVVYENNITSVYPKGEVDAKLGYYNCWLNKHNLCKPGGYIISENPKEGNWPGHGYSYISKDFYKLLVLLADYELIRDGTHPAMGNYIDGWNVYSVLKKTGDRFPDFDKFLKLPIYDK